jgi:RNA polymerase-interacting CarD/CdnL/TRCF family regulator
MRFRTNDWLVHPQYGVGRVVKLETKQIGLGTRLEYYEIAISTGTVWVPVEGHPSGLRKVTLKDDLGRYRVVLKGRPTPLAADHKQRHLTLVERLKESTLQAKCEVVRDLMAFRWSKSLNESSSMMLRSTRHFLCSEWAAAEGLSIAEATDEIDALLLEGKATYESIE